MSEYEAAIIVAAFHGDDGERRLAQDILFGLSPDEESERQARHPEDEDPERWDGQS